MRYYGNSYLDSLIKSISSARNTVDDPVYQKRINDTSVPADYFNLRSDCASVASSAEGHIRSVKDKFDDLIVALTSFYGDVDETAGIIASKIEIAQGLIDSAMNTIVLLSEAVKETGNFKGVKVNADVVNTVGIYFQETAYPFLYTYYYGLCVNDDGSFNFEPLSSFLDSLDQKIKNGEQLSATDALIMHCLEYVTIEYLDSHDFSEAEYDEFFTKYLSCLYVQNFDVCTTSEDISGGYDTVIIGDEEYSRVWYQYTLRPSASFFVNSFSTTEASMFLTSGQSEVSFINSHINSMQFSDCLMAVCRDNQALSLPYIVTDIDEYATYRTENCIDLDNLDGTYFLNDGNVVKMPFFGTFHINREVISDGSRPSYVSTITFSNGTFSYEYLDEDGNPMWDDDNELFENEIEYITVCTCEDNLFGDLSETLNSDYRNVLDAAHIEVKGWETFLFRTALPSTLNMFFTVNFNRRNEEFELSPDNHSKPWKVPSIPNISSSTFTNIGSAISFVCDCTGQPVAILIGKVVLLIGKAFDFSIERDNAKAMNEYLDSCGKAFEDKQKLIFFFNNTRASGSYYIDNASYDSYDNLVLLPNFYYDSSYIQVLTSYICYANRYQPFVIGSGDMPKEIIDSYFDPDLNVDSFEYCNGVSTYYALFQLDHTEYPPFGCLTADDVNDVCAAFNKDFWEEHCYDSVDFYSMKNYVPDSIPGINPNDYKE